MNKLASARFYLALMFGLTACISALKGIIPSEAFCTMVGSIVTHYFMKDRRANASNKE